MKIRWLGQSCFEIVLNSGIRIVTDPFAQEGADFPGLKLSYPIPDIEADIVVVSHMGHFDHDAINIVKGNPIVVNKPGEIEARGIRFKGFGTYHLTADGFSPEPFNNVFYWETEGLKLCHLGDLGHLLNKEQIARLEGTDILFVPLGEGFAMPFDVVIENIKLIKPKVVIPMHYKTDEAPFLPKSVEDFLRICDLEPWYPGETLEISNDTLPSFPAICILRGPMPYKTTVAIAHRDEIGETPGNYTEQSLSIIRDMVREAIDNIGGIERYVKKGDTVLIRPNTVNAVPPDLCATTDPRVVAALLDLILERVDVKEIKVGDYVGLNFLFDCKQAMEVTGLEKVLKDPRVKMVELDAEPAIHVSVPKPKALPDFYVPKSIWEADVYIIVPKLKTHLMSRLSCSLKMGQGVYGWRDKRRNHREDIAQKMIDTYKVVRPNLILVDAIWTMQGNGPLSLYPYDIIKDMNTIIAGSNGVAVDAVATNLMGFDFDYVPTNRLCRQENLGVFRLREIEIAGTSMEKVRRKYRKATCDIAGVFPKVDVYMGGTCDAGCMACIRGGFDGADAMGLLDKLPGPVAVVTGRIDETFHELIEGSTLGRYVKVIAVGECVRDFALSNPNVAFIPGCCPITAFGKIPEIIKSLVK